MQDSKDSGRQQSNGMIAKQRLIAIGILGAISVITAASIAVLRLHDVHTDPALAMALGNALGALTGILAKPPS